MKTLKLNPFKMPFLMKGILVLLLAVTVSACKEEEPTPENPITQDIMEIVDGTADVSTLKVAIDAAGLRTTLEGDGPFTVFAPTDAAFEALEMANPGITAYLLENTDELTKVLTYHVVAAEAKSTDLVAGSLATVNGQTVEIDLSSGVKVNDATVTTADVLATNGVIHIINKVLVPDNLNLPEPQPTQSIMEIVDATASVSTLKAAIDAASLRATLDGDGPFTVFAPTDDAFSAFSTANPGVLEFLLMNPTELAKVLTYHVVSGNVMSGDLTNGNVATVNGEEVTVDLTSGVKINDANVTGADVAATNGVIHVIDKVLVPSNLNIPANLNPDGTEMTIADLAIATDDLSTLVSILSLPGLSDILAAADNPEATLTVFAPTNEAFAGVLTALGLTSIDEIPESVLLDIVKYHIVGSVAKSTDLMSQDYATLNGESVTVDLSGDGVKVDDANVAIADVIGSNGVVHVVDAVLLPSLYSSAIGTIVEVPLFRKDFSILTSALVKADLVTTLLGDNGGNKFTVFAPNNAAFAAAGLDQAAIDGLEVSALAPILLYHVLGSEVLAAGLPSTGAAAPAKQATLGGDIYISNRGGDAGVFINGGIQVTGTDIVKSNGVIHTISQTLLPADMTIAGKATALGFTRLVDALVEAGLDGTFAGAGDFTVFAPTNAAFDALYTALGVSTTDPNPEKQVDIALGAGTLEAVLKYHVIGARVFSSDLEDALTATTLGGTFTVNVSANGVSITDNDPDFADANVVATDVTATNGVIHAIDAVLLPVNL